MLRTINNIGTLKGKKVLLRTDFDVPVAKEEVPNRLEFKNRKKQSIIFLPAVQG